MLAKLVRAGDQDMNRVLTKAMRKEAARERQVPHSQWRSLRSFLCAPLEHISSDDDDGDDDKRSIWKLQACHVCGFARCIGVSVYRCAPLCWLSLCPFYLATLAARGRGRGSQIQGAVCGYSATSKWFLG